MHRFVHAFLCAILQACAPAPSSSDPLLFRPEQAGEKD